MRRILLILLAIVVVLVALVVILPFVIPVDAYRGQIEQAATNATGRQLKINGDLRLTVFPELGLTANKVTLANAPGGHAPYLASMDSLQVGVRLLPLLSGKLQVSQVTLNKPQINLEVDKAGKGNWALGGASKTATPGEAAGGGVAAAAQASFQGLHIANGRISYRDDATGLTRSLDNINLTIGLTSLNEPVTLDGSLTTGGQNISLDGRIASLAALMGGKATAVDLSLTSDLVQASFKGELARGSADGMLKLDTPSLRNLAAWAGHKLAPGGGLQHLSLEGKLSAKGTTDSFSAIHLVLDKMTLTGTLTLDRSKPVPYVSGTLAVDDLDLNPYLTTPSQTAGANSTAPAEPKSPASAASWSTKPIELSALKLMNAALTLDVGKLEIRKLRIGKSHLVTTLNNGALNLNLDPVTLYGGSGKATISVNSAGNTAHIANTTRFANLAIQPFLNDALGIDRIEGTGALNLDVTATGKSPNAIMHALAGKGDITFRDGHIRGVDLASVARTIQSALAGSATASSASTAFTEMGGTFTITNGVMTTKDFHLLSPFIRMTGAGNVNLGEQTIDLVVDPKAVASLEGQGGSQSAAGIGIPFRITGPWSHIRYSPDLSGVASGILKSVTKGGLSSKSVLQGLLGGAQQSGQSTPDQGTNNKNQPAPKNPADVLKGLFGGH